MNSGTGMAKSKHRPQQPIPTRTTPPPPPAPSPTVQVQLGYDPAGPKESVDIVSSKDGWSEYQLADGTVLRAKTVVLDVKKLIGQYNQDGEPVYEMQMTMVNQARVPENLKKKKD
jgi:hypothetical protein